MRETEKRKDTFAYDELKHESVFYRQAQDAVLECIPKLHALGVKTKRPEDYFAEMAKTNEHMQKVYIIVIFTS
jgi:rRNA-processing protein EBP2